MSNPITPEEMKNRYIYQVSRFLPAKGWEETAKEIRGLIDDMTAARCGEKEPDLSDMKAILAELGRPSELAAKYNDSKMYLVGPLYFPMYCKTLAVMEGITVAATLLSLVISLINRTFVGEDLFNIIPSLLGIFAVVTLVFFMIERQGMKLDDLFDMEAELPPVPKDKEQIKRSEPIVSLVFSFLFLILIVGYPRVFGFWNGEAGQMIPIFDLGVIASCAYLFVIGFLCEVAKSAAQLVEGRYSFRLLAVYLPSRMIALAATYYLIASHTIWNPNLISEISAIFPKVIHVIAFSELTQNLNTAILIIAFFGTAVDMLVTTFRTFRYSGNRFDSKA